jgi:hypothetical protein
MSIVTVKDKVVELGGTNFWWHNDTATPSADAIGTLDGAWAGTVSSVAGPSQGPSALESSVLVSSGSNVRILDTAVLPLELQTMGAATAGFAVGCWISTLVTGGYYSIWVCDNVFLELRQQVGSTTHIPFSFGVNDLGKFSVGRAWNGSGGCEIKVASSLPSINDDAWHFVAAIRAGSELTLVVDDQSETVTISDLDTSCGVVASNFSIASRTTDSGVFDNYTPGRYAGVFVIPNAITVTEVDKIRQLGLQAELSGSSIEIPGVVTLDGSPVQADLYLVDLAQLTPIQSSAVDGTYQFLDPGDHSVIPNSQQIYMLCDYGTGVRPLAHGPIVPMVYVATVDEYWNNVSLLLPFDGSIEDVSDNALSITVNGEATVSATESKWGGSSMYFDGVDDRLSISNNSLFDFGTGDFTVELWVMPTSLSSDARIVSKSPYRSYSGWMLRLDAGGSFEWRNSDGSSTESDSWFEQISSVSLSSDTWYHLAVARSSGQQSMFVDGVLTALADNTDNIVSSTDFTIGAANTDDAYFKGYLDDLRITKGIARYTADFNPPTRAFPTSGA